jgi:hypothetical protein
MAAPPKKVGNKRRNVMLTRKVISELIVALLLVSANAFAESSLDYNSQQQPRQQQSQGQKNGASRVPPDSAISACSGKSEGATCEVTGPNGTKQGVCAYTPDNKYYACKPNDMNRSEPLSQR